MNIPPRRRFQECLKCLRAAASNPNLSWVLRIRACELILCAHDIELPGGSGKRDKKAIKQVIDERRFEKDLEKEVRANVQRTTRTAEREAKAFLEKVRKGDTE